MRDQQSLRSACAYAQSDQSLCLSLDYLMIVKLLTEHHLDFLNFNEAAQTPLSLHLEKCHIVGNYMLRLITGPRRKKTCLRGFADNTDVDQPAHPRSLISTFVIRFLKTIICKLATGEILTF